MNRTAFVSMRGLALGLVVAAVGACSSAGPGGVATPCVSDGECPSGQICVNSQCAQPGLRDGGPRPDGGATLDGGGATLDGGSSEDGGATPDGGSSEDGGATLDGGSADGGVVDAGGLFGGPCATNADCQSLICIQTSSGGVCTKPCSQDCPLDWGCRIVNTTPVCMPPELAKCSTCTTDSECGGQYRCSTYGGASVCLRACTAQGDCGANEVCRGLGDGGADGDAGSAGRCVPSEDSRNCGACGTTCATGQTCCNDRCVDLRTDETACGLTCAAARACTGSETCCGGSCVDVLASDTHCGACLGEGGATCTGADARCCGGACVNVRDNRDHCGSCNPCGASDTCCGLSCVNLTNDPSHCGACSGGASVCDSGKACCASACTSLPNNDAHCGACGNNCATQGLGAGAKCCGDRCVDKLTDKTACGDGCATCSGTTPGCCSGVCKDLANDPMNCGMCGRGCGAGETCCGGTCKNLATDATFCGTTCGNATACGSGSSCCSGACKNTTGGDTTNCGGCGQVCGGNVTLPQVQTYTCQTSQCTVATCVSGYSDCNAQPGCETQQAANTSCGAADGLGTLSDYEGGGAIEATRTAQVIVPGQSRWYKVRAEDTPGDDWKLLAKVFNISTGLEVDLYAYRRAPGSTCGANPAVPSGGCNENISGCSGSQKISNRCSTNAGSAAECVQWFEVCSFPEDDETEVWIEVRHVGGGCGTFDLKVRNNGNNDSLTCSNF